MKLNENVLKELCELTYDFKQLLYMISLDNNKEIKDDLQNIALEIADDFSSIFISEVVCKKSWEKYKKREI